MNVYIRHDVLMVSLVMNPDGLMSIYLDNYARHLLANNCNVSPSWASSGNAYKTKYDNKT